MVGVRQFDETRVIREALRLFSERGLSGTTMGDLAQASGVLRGSLYNAYGGKDEIFILAFESYTREVLTRFREALDRPTLREALQGAFTAAIRSIRGNAERRGCLTTRMALEDHAHQERIRAGLEHLLGELETMLAQALEPLCAAGDNRMPAPVMARLIVTFTRGLAVIDRIYDDGARLRGDADALLGLMCPQEA
ncbi:TetR family transcriptional regulator [Breoghania sp. JC706]|uniref:TetR/AcrR family transcriptional regulator n=1 Tax=Breoghania sp. JC706 TaxID=3117732 RepID=UPI00300AF07B